MIDFELIKKSQITEFQKYYDNSSAMNYDVNLLCVYLWRNEYNIKFAVYDDTLIKAYFTGDGSIWGYVMPSGKNVKGALNKIFEDAYERNIVPRIVMLTTAQRALLESLYPSRFNFEPSPENNDYIYLTKDLVMLSGKKFHSKRNHISKFYRTFNDTRFETIDDNNKDDALKVVYDWCAENNIDSEDYEEVRVIKEALSIRKEFDMRGAVLYVDDKPAAMTLGSEISRTTFDINFEKALREYDGIYSVINNEFAKTLTEYKYINREEDMGIEGLRKSKLSYNPEIILERFNAVPR